MKILRNTHHKTAMLIFKGIGCLFHFIVLYPEKRIALVFQCHTLITQCYEKYNTSTQFYKIV